MADDGENGKGRDRIAENVIFWSGVGIAITTLTVLGANAYSKSENLAGISTTVFNTLIPLFGTWVGTVLAFYFASKNFEAASKSTQELVGQLGDERLKQILVKDAWIPVSAIDAVQVEPGEENTVKVSEIKKRLNNKVTRIPIWNAAKVVRYVIHESMIYKFLADVHEEAADKAAKAAAAGEQMPPPPDKTLQDFLDCSLDGVSMKEIVSKIGWVPQTATLADAKAKMEGTPNCQDVFVTNTGAATEPVLGWVTNVDISKKMKA